jgi:FMN phosphatase YigB (HAD superfamily)
MAVRGVVFDLDGTLYGMPWYMKPLLFASLVPHGMRLPAYMRARAEHAGRDHGSGGALMAALCADLARRIGRPPQEMQAWVEGPFYSRFTGFLYVLRHTRPGLAEALQDLRRRGIRLAVLSDFGRVAERLKALALDTSLFDCLQSSEDAGALKPAVRPFETIVAQWALPPAEILVVGDRDDTDGAGARAAGMQFMRLGRGGKRGNPWPVVRESLAGLGG